MYTQPSRPRAPSAATLRLLYQLAYISSGTALGVGALCAEERRRRTKVVQTIADNARRIRQSPRYIQNAALAAQNSDDAVEFLSFAHSRRSRFVEGEERGALGPELPSVVTREYERTSEKSKPPVRRLQRARELGQTERTAIVSRRKSDSENRSLLTRSSDSETKDQASADSQSRYSGTKLKTTSYPGARAIHRERLPSRTDYKPTTLPKSSDSAGSGALLDDIVVYKHRKYTSGGLSTESLERETVDTRQLLHLSESGTRYEASPDSLRYINAQFRTRPYWCNASSSAEPRPRSVNSATPVPNDELTSDVDKFFDMMNTSSDPATRMSVEQADEICEELILLSLHAGHLDDLKSLISWKSAVDQLSERDLFQIARSWRSLAVHGDHAEICQFSTDLLASDTFKKLPESRRLELAVELSIQAFLETGSLSEPFDRTSFPPLELAKKYPNFKSVVSQKCQGLVAEGSIRPAVFLALTVPFRKWEHPSRITMAQQLFDAALQRRSLSLCGSLIKWTGGSIRNGVITKPLIEAYIDACGRAKADGMLQALFSGQGYNRTENSALLKSRQEDESFGESSYVQLCLAFANGGTNTSTHFKTCFARLSANGRNIVKEDSLQARVACLKTKWASTRNLDQVQAEYRSASDWAVSKEDQDGANQLHLAMVKICLSARRYDGAMRALSLLGQTTPGDTIKFVAALAFAKQQDWEAFEYVLDVLRDQQPRPKWTADNRSTFDEILSLYARDHTAEQTRDLCLRVMSEFDFKPGASTTAVLLSKFVTDKCPMMMIQWFRSQWTQGQELKVGPSLAAQLISQFCLSNRPNHVLVIWLCRNLVTLAPSLDCSRLRDVVIEAISYDLRKLRGTHSSWQLPNAVLRLKYVQQSSEFPRPGKVRGGQIVEGSLAPSNLEEELPRDITAAPQTSSLGSNKAHSIPDGKPAALDSTASHGSAVRSAKDAEFSGQSVEDRLWQAIQEDVPEQGIEVLSELEEITRHSLPQGDQDELSPLIDPLFSDLRPDYENLKAPSSMNVDDAAKTVAHVDRIESRMILAFSLGRYDSVLDLYRKHTDAVGIPSNPIALELAIEASLRLNDSDPTQAHELMSTAEKAGMNVNRSVGPLILHRLRKLERVNRTDVITIRTMVIDYYRVNEENGWAVKHHVAVMAAHKLIRVGYPEHGVNILNAIHRAPWAAQQRSFDIVPMTVMLDGYAAMKHEAGIKWVVSRVLDSDMRIDQSFLTVLKQARRPFRPRNYGRRRQDFADPLVEAKLQRLDRWRHLCGERRVEQQREARNFASKLVKILARQANNGGSARCGYAQSVTTEEGNQEWRLLNQRREDPPKRLRRVYINETIE